MVGATNAWRLIHIQTGLLYKMCGVDKAKELGGREAKWTDEDVVETISFIQELADKGILEKILQAWTMKLKRLCL